MATEKQKADWVKVDPATLGEALKTRWAALAKANAAQREAKAEFESAFISAAAKGGRKLPADKKFIFGYQWGGLSFAIVDKDEERKPKGTLSWTDLFSK